MRRRGLVGGVGVHRHFSCREAIFQFQDFARQAVDLLPLGSDHLVEIIDRCILMCDADFESVEAGSVGHAGFLAHWGRRRKQSDRRRAELRPLTELAAIPQWSRLGVEARLGDEPI